jgi:hypothetical protein
MTQQTIMGFTVLYPANAQISKDLFSLLLSQKYPALTFEQVKYRIGHIVEIDFNGACLTIKSIEP